MGKKTNTNGIADNLGITKIEFKQFVRTVQGLVNNPSLSHADVESAINQCHQNGIEQPTPDDAANVIVPTRQSEIAAKQAEKEEKYARLQQINARRQAARQRQDKLRTCRKKSALVVEVSRTTKELRSIFAANLERQIEEAQKIVVDKLVAADDRIATAEKTLDGLKKRVIQLEKAKKPTASETPSPPTPIRNRKQSFDDAILKDPFAKDVEDPLAVKLGKTTKSSKTPAVPNNLLQLRNVDPTERWGFWKDIYLPSLKSLPDQDAFKKFQDETDRGRGQLQPNQLDQYVAAYGGHHYHKLRDAFDRADFASYCQKNIEIIDWGCGQAIATCVLLDYLLEKNIEANIAKITLIEPSHPAIAKGAHYLQRMVAGYAFGNNVVERCAEFIGNITPATISSDPKNNKIHLFSNILDVPSVDLQHLHQVVCASQKGLNKFICVSPNHLTKTRLNYFRDRFSQPAVGKEFYETNHLIARVYNHVKSFPYIPGTWANNYEIDRYERQFTIVI